MTDNMTESKQHAWDRLLIEGWVLDKRVTQTAWKFILINAPILAKLKDWHRIVKYITSLELKRCRDVGKADGALIFNPHTIRVRTFVDNHSRHLTNCLYSEEVENHDILENIDNFKWSPRNNYNHHPR